MQRPGDQPPAASEKFAELQVEIRERAHHTRRSRARRLWSGTAVSYSPTLYTQARLLSETPPTFSLRKEVIQPQVLLRLPCYDFTPIMNHTLGRCLPCGSALQTSSTIHFRDVTGGVYKARERIHGSVLICHY